jgi:hypothetical protein
MLLALLVALLQPLPGQAQARTATAIQKAQIAQRTASLNAVKTVAEADALVGRTVTFDGTLHHCKIAPCLVVEGFVIEPVYLFGDPKLARAWVGQTVRATGVLERTGRFKAVRADDGTWSQGTGGDVYLLKASVVVPR